MKYTSLIDNITAKKWGISIPEAYLFDWIYSLPSWAEKVVISGQDFFFASKTKAITELPLITDKVDTMYRYYRALEERGLIILKKVEGKDYVCLTAKAKQWNRKSEYSEKNPDSDLNPTELGKKSEKHSEKNPTYKNTIYDKITIDKNTLASQVMVVFNELRKKYGNNVKHVDCKLTKQRQGYILAREKDFHYTFPEAKADFLTSMKLVMEYKAMEWTKTDIWKNFEIETLFAAKHFIQYCEQAKSNEFIPPKKYDKKEPQEIKASLPKNYRPA